MRGQITEPKIEVKMHRFTLNILKSTTKGAMQKAKGGIWRVADENKYIYECAPCGTAIQLDVKIDLYTLNKEASLRFPCL